MSSIRTSCRKVICIGRNYADHITELKNPRPKQPFFFLKPPSSILPPGAGPVLAPRGVNIHYEIELGAIIGRPVRDFDDSGSDAEQRAVGVVDGYCLAIDLTGRNVQEEAKRKGLPWTIAKGFDTFLPISQYISKSQIPDPHDVHLKLAVNGEVKQSDSTGLMLFRLPALLASISRVMTLEPGDLVLTGTPKGVGPVRVGERMIGGLSVGGREVREAAIEVGVEEKGGAYEFKET